jgi:hypothetical protein
MEFMDRLQADIKVCRFEPLAAATWNRRGMQRQTGSILGSCRAGNTAARTPPNLTTPQHSRHSQSIKKSITVYVIIINYIQKALPFA